MQSVCSLHESPNCTFLRQTMRSTFFISSWFPSQTHFPLSQTDPTPMPFSHCEFCWHSSKWKRIGRQSYKNKKRLSKESCPFDLLTSPFTEDTKSLSQAHLWSKQVTFEANLWHSSSDSQCSSILTRLRQLLSWSVKFLRQLQEPSEQKAFLSYLTHCSFISHGWDKWTAAEMHLLPSKDSMKPLSQRHVWEFKSQLEWGMLQLVRQAVPSLLLTLSNWNKFNWMKWKIISSIELQDEKKLPLECKWQVHQSWRSCICSSIPNKRSPPFCPDNLSSRSYLYRTCPPCLTRY